MRTRRSPRNQERLWKELGGAKPKQPGVHPLVTAVNALMAYKASGALNKRTLRQLERDVEREWQKAAVRRALEKETT